MKKSFLLYTVSGVLFCSYSGLSHAYNAVTPPPATSFTPTYPTHDTLKPGELTSSPYSEYMGRTPLQNSDSSETTFLTTPPSSFPAGGEESLSPVPRSRGRQLPLTRSYTTENSYPTTESRISLTDTASSTTISKPVGTLQPSPHEESVPKPTTETLSRPERPQGGSSSSASLDNTRNQPVPSISRPSVPEKQKPNLLPAPTRAVIREQSAPRKPVPEQPPHAAPGKPLPGQPPHAQLEKPVQAEDVKNGIEAKDGKTITLHNAKIQDKNFAVIARGKNAIVNMTGGTVTSDFVAFSVSDGGIIDAKGVTVTAGIVGVVNMNGAINLKDSTIHVTADHIAEGIIFRNSISDNRGQNPPKPRRRNSRAAEGKAVAVQSPNVSNNVILDNTKLFVKNGIGISAYGTHEKGEISLKNSEIHADVLLKNTKEEKAPEHTIVLTTDRSLLKGRARTLKESKTVFNLENNTKWFLKANKNARNNDDKDPNHTRFGVDNNSYSNLSELKLINSVIAFDEPEAGRHQVLFVGANPQKKDQAPSELPVYTATGNAEIHLNSKWSDHSPVTEQATDRVIINGNVSGSTVVHINLQGDDKKITDKDAVREDHEVASSSETHGISVIQVSGNASEDSFRLAKKYTTMRGLPYRYVLTAYAPGTSRASQNLLVNNDRNFWDFRLQNAYIDKDKRIRALVPQVANYLVMPNALFSTGFTDVNNQNVMLDNMRATIFGLEDRKKKGIFLSSYGEKVTLSSNSNPLQYGYASDVNYFALQAGVVLSAIESKDLNTYFGLLGTYGKLAFTPKDMEDSEKTTLDKWSVTAYGGLQHNSGLYVNTLLSYGSLKGSIATAFIKDAAKLDGTEILSASATIGQKLETDVNGLVFEPQAQLVYQNLMFDIISDADNLKVDMGRMHQWLMRVGGRLTQTLASNVEDHIISFYSKLNIIKAFGDDKTIKITDTFYLDHMGSSIEGGVGVNAHLSQNIVLHGDISYRHKLQKAGISGTTFSGGIRYRF
ncbi:autotransporter family protein [Bartonella sp. CB169]|uniref:autotransporter family protein n=1 Tax=Bartonella sp. CB169 TaxID=3112257 RepID=UPI00300E242D